MKSITTSLNSILTQAAQDHSNRHAIDFGSSCLTYDELYSLATCYAQIFGSHGASDQAFVGIMARRSSFAYASVLGSILSGSVYVPLNPQNPIARNAEIVSETNIGFLVVDEDTIGYCEDVLATQSGKIVVLHSNVKKLGEMPSRLPQHDFVDIRSFDFGLQLDKFLKEIAENSIAYIMYTSGSTGKPKGAVIARGNLSEFILACRKQFQITQADRCSQLHDLSFDLSVFDLFVTWSQGACLCVPSDVELKDSAFYIERRGITLWHSVPSLVLLMQKQGALCPNRYESLKTTIFVGEPLPKHLAIAWADAAPNSTLECAYGPTETTVMCTVYQWDRSTSPASLKDKAIVPIGLPFSTTQHKIVNEAGDEVENGEAGELWLAGAQVALGYWQMEQKTSEVFIDECSSAKLRYYRTGDLVCYDSLVNTMHFLGRIDNQIQVRGHRVELSEIESALYKISSADLCIAMGLNEKFGSAESVFAYVMTENIDEPGLKKELEALLPHYMIPKRILAIQEFPRTPNGKVDKFALRKNFENVTQNAKNNSIASTNGAVGKWNDSELIELEESIEAENSYIESIIIDYENGRVSAKVSASKSIYKLIDAEDSLSLHQAASSISESIGNRLNREFPSASSELALVNRKIAELPKGQWSKECNYERFCEDSYGVPVLGTFYFRPGTFISQKRVSENGKETLTMRIRVGEAGDWLSFGLFDKLESKIIRAIVYMIDIDHKELVAMPGSDYTKKVWRDRARKIKQDKEVEIPDPFEMANQLTRSEDEFRTCLEVYGKLIAAGIVKVGKRKHSSKSSSMYGANSLIRADSEQLYFLFPGAALVDVLQIPPLVFLQETGLAQESVIIMRDRSFSSFIKGISFSTSTIEDMLQFQLGVMQGVPQAKHRYTIGTSAGAFAAIVTGYKLKLDSVWAFGLARHRKAEIDLREMLSKPNGITEFNLYYNEDCVKDREVAESLRDFPGVRLFSQSSDHHFVVHTLWESGKLASVFPIATKACAQEFLTSVSSLDNVKADQTGLILQCLRSVIGARCDQITVESNFQDSLDSFELVEFLVVLEQAIGRKINLGAISKHSLDTISSLAMWLEKSSE